MDSLEEFKSSSADVSADDGCDIQPLVQLQSDKPVKRCQHSDCRKRLTAIDKMQPCKCTMLFCSAHRFAADHNCEFDYKADWARRQKIERNRKFKNNGHVKSSGGVY